MQSFQSSLTLEIQYLIQAMSTQNKELNTV